MIIYRSHASLIHCTWLHGSQTRKLFSTHVHTEYTTTIRMLTAKRSETQLATEIHSSRLFSDNGAYVPSLRRKRVGFVTSRNYRLLTDRCCSAVLVGLNWRLYSRGLYSLNYQCPSIKSIIWCWVFSRSLPIALFFFFLLTNSWTILLSFG